MSFKSFTDWLAEEQLDESVKIVDRDSDLDQEHFKIQVNGKEEHFVHHNYENSHATDSKEDLHYQVKKQLKHLSPAHQKAVTNAVHASYRMKEETELDEATYQGKKVPLNKPMAGDVKKSKVYVDPDGDGKAKKVNFGDKNMTIKKHIPGRRKNFRARHNCDTAKDKTTPRYWSCKAW